MGFVLAFKLALVPLLIGGVTLAGRRWGPAVAGWLSAFPVVAGPILIFIAIEQGVVFAKSAALATLSAILAILVFGLSYAWAATRYTWQLSVAWAFICYFLAVFVLNSFRFLLGLALLAVIAALWIAPRLYPTIDSVSFKATGRKNDMLLRMLAGAALVLLVTYFSPKFGPHLSGLLAMFPVMTSVLVVFTHRQSGPAFAIQLLRGTVFGYYAFASFCVAVLLLLPWLGIPAAFTSAFIVAATVQAFSSGILNRQQRS